jgi:hypothetical protein
VFSWPTYFPVSFQHWCGPASLRELSLFASFYQFCFPVVLTRNPVSWDSICPPMFKIIANFGSTATSSVIAGKSTFVFAPLLYIPI